VFHILSGSHYSAHSTCALLEAIVSSELFLEHEILRDDVVADTRLPSEELDWLLRLNKGQGCTQGRLIALVSAVDT
jgi:hypothetical protein